MCKKMMKSLYLLPVLALLIFSCNSRENQAAFSRDWAQIKAKGKLTVLTENSTLSYFEFRGKQMGFEYEILDTFCKANGLKLEVKSLNKLEDFSKYLNKGEGDVIAAKSTLWPIACHIIKLSKFWCKESLTP
jgi:membrane-bound lytic murein transglycosylase F